MITVRPSGERVHRSQAAHEAWHTFGQRGRTGSVQGLGALLLFDEEVLPPGVAESALSVDAEVLLYVREGSITFPSGMDDVVLVAGDFLHHACSRRVQVRARNASTSGVARVFRIGLLPSAVARPLGTQWSRVGLAQRQSGLRVVASEDGREESLGLARDVTVYSAVLPAGRHVVTEIGMGRSVWVHIVTGRGQLGALELAAGDGAGLVGERALSFTASEETEVLVIELPSLSTAA